MRNVIWVFVMLAAIASLVVAGYSVLVIGMDVFGERTAMTGMGLAVGAAGLLVALLIGLAAALGRRYLKEHPG